MPTPDRQTNEFKIALETEQIRPVLEVLAALLDPHRSVRDIAKEFNVYPSSVEEVYRLGREQCMPGLPRRTNLEPCFTTHGNPAIPKPKPRPVMTTCKTCGQAIEVRQAVYVQAVRDGTPLICSDCGCELEPTEQPDAR